MALEAGDVPVPGAGSQLGWLLWAGRARARAAQAAAARLCEPDILTDFGLRTLASRDPNFGPAHYHRGAVWPFDSLAGLGRAARGGPHAEAERVRTGVLAALDGSAARPSSTPSSGGLAPIALSNRVQAWTIGARWAFEHGWDGERVASWPHRDFGAHG